MSEKLELKDIAEEVWVDVFGYEGLYMVSNLGRIKSLDRQCAHNYGGLRTKKGRFLSQKSSPSGYISVRLSKDKDEKTFRLHRLIAEAFIPNSQKLEFVNHKNGIKTDNRVCNLEWCTAKQNIEHAWSIGLGKKVLNYQEISEIVGRILPYAAHDVGVSTPRGRGRILIDSTVLRIVYDNGRMENLILALRRYRENVKLHLRNMPDLIKPLPDGTIPIVALFMIASNNSIVESEIIIQSLVKNTVFIAHYMKSEVLGFDTSTQSFFAAHKNKPCSPSNQVDLFNYLYAHHFDINNLIGRGLAIGINEVEL